MDRWVEEKEIRQIVGYCNNAGNPIMFNTPIIKDKFTIQTRQKKDKFEV